VTWGVTYKIENILFRKNKQFFFALYRQQQPKWDMQQIGLSHVTHWNTLQLTATHCNTLQRTATHCNTLQHTATHCNILPQWVMQQTGLSHECVSHIQTSHVILRAPCQEWGGLGGCMCVCKHVHTCMHMLAGSIKY